jgi:hypothetical protein
MRDALLKERPYSFTAHQGKFSPICIFIKLVRIFVRPKILAYLRFDEIGEIHPLSG